MNRHQVPLVWLGAGLFLLTASAAAQQSAHYHYQQGQRIELRVDPTRSVAFTGQPELKSHAARSSKSATPKDESPVLVDPRNNQIRALPGGVVVTLPEGVDSTSARLHLQAMNLKIRAAIVEPRVWLVESPIGLESLDLANKLHESGKVHAAEPNWWRERKAK